MKELKETDLNKRDSKALYKNLQKASTSEEMTKEMVQIWLQVEEHYVSSLIRCPLDPTVWLDDEYPKSENEIVHKIMIKGKF